MIRSGFLFAVFVWLATGAHALELPSNAVAVFSSLNAQDQYDVPIAPFDGVRVPSRALKGAVRKETWRIPGRGLTSFQIMDPIRLQLENRGLTRILECNSSLCGGFDFRFGTEILPAPSMFVDLSSFQFLTMIEGDISAPISAVTVLVSTLRDSSFVQIIEARVSGDLQAKASASGRPATARSVTNAPIRKGGLLDLGFEVLDDLDFQSGATELGNGPYQSLESLAALMKQNPKLRIALVGHTDATGSLAGNIRISRARAASVRDRLVANYGLSEDRLEAEGMGYLAPRASNLTAQGREANRRVEAIVLSN